MAEENKNESNFKTDLEFYEFATYHSEGVDWEDVPDLSKEYEEYIKQFKLSNGLKR